MTTAPLIFLGASPFREVGELVRDINDVSPTFDLRAILDDDPSLHGTEVEGLPVLGSLETARDHGDARFAFAIASHGTRLACHAILERLALPPERYATLVHPRAKVYSSATVGHGSIIHCGAVIGNGARLGNWVTVHWNAVVGADNRIGDGALLTSNVTTNSGVKIGPYGFIGSASAVAEGVTVGPGAMVGMGSLVLRDVPAGVFQFGNPPRVLSREDVPQGILDEWKRELA